MAPALVQAGGDQDLGYEGGRNRNMFESRAQDFWLERHCWEPGGGLFSKLRRWI